jgi:hypothetical protein
MENKKMFETTNQLWLWRIILHFIANLRYPATNEKFFAG